MLDFAAPIYKIINSYTPEVCYDELGCFRNDGIFATSQIRPISVVPQPPQFIGTEYHLYTRGNPNNPQIIDAFNTNYFSQIEFNPKFNTKVIIHGYEKRMIFFESQQVSVLIINIFLDIILILASNLIIHYFHVKNIANKTVSSLENYVIYAFLLKIIFKFFRDLS
jgi:hypothetical protein